MLIFLIKTFKIRFLRLSSFLLQISLTNNLNRLTFKLQNYSGSSKWAPSTIRKKSTTWKTFTKSHLNPNRWVVRLCCRLRPSRCSSCRLSRRVCREPDLPARFATPRITTTFRKARHRAELDLWWIWKSLQLLTCRRK